MFCFIISLFLSLLLPLSSGTTPPNIVIIIGDDIGSNDFGFRSSNEILTPNIDAMGSNGVILDKFYTQPSCSPTRAALLTGNFPIRSGMQGYASVPGEDVHPPVNMTMMSEHLNRLGYQSHMVGKWHLGSAMRQYTPTGRGFLTHFGYWNGYTHYYNYTCQFWGDKTSIGFDLHNAFKPEYGYAGTYATDLFTAKASDIIDNHNITHPLFLVLAHQGAHVAFEELQVRNITETNTKYHYIKNEQRRRYASIVGDVDDSVGVIFKKLGERGMLNNSVVLFLSDNGGPTVGSSGNTGSNWPLRGIKNTNFEGGIRGSATLYSPLLQKQGYVNRRLIHLVDFLPTFYKIAGGNLKDLGQIDGVDQWETLSQDLESKRTEFIVDIDEVANTSSVITDGGKYKLIQGNFDVAKISLMASGHHGKSGQGKNFPPYNALAVLNSHVNTECTKISKINRTQNEFLRNRVQNAYCNHKRHWWRRDNGTINCTNPVCLFDLEKDPCEYHNLVHKHPDIVTRLLNSIEKYAERRILQHRQVIDPKGNPKFYNNTWCTYLEDSLCPKAKEKSDGVKFDINFVSLVIVVFVKYLV